MVPRYSLHSFSITGYLILFASLMPEHKQVGQELWICEAAQCIVPPSTHMVLQGNDQHFYPARLVEVGSESLIDWISLDSCLMGFEEHKEVLSFCRKISLRLF